MPNPPLTKNIGFYNKYQKYANKLIQFGGEYNCFIKNIKNINDDILKKLDESQSDCWKITEMNSSLSRKKHNYDVMYMIEKNKIIFSTYINVYKKHKFVYLNSICASNEYRGKGLFRKALDYIKDYYKKLGFESIKLNADNTDDNGLNQKKRIEIFNKVGFEIDPILDYYDDKNNYIQTKTKVKLDNGKIVEYNKDIENQVEKCYYDSIEYPCPMILHLRQLGGSNSLNFDTARMIQNCNLCYNNAVIYLFYSIPEFRNAVLTLTRIENTNKLSTSIPEQVDINLLLEKLKQLFNLMNKANTFSTEIVDDNFVLCNTTNNFYKEYIKNIKDSYIIANNNKGGIFRDNNIYDYSGNIMSGDEFNKIDNNEMGYLNISLFNFMTVYSDIIDKLFCYFIDSGEKVYIIEDGAPIHQYNKYLIRPPFKKDDNPDEYDYINIKEKSIKFNDDNIYELVGILSGVYIPKQDGFEEGPGGHYWFDIYDKTTNQFIMINDLENSVERNYERDKNPTATPAISWLIYEKIYSL